jgi:hypothetical protein
MLSGVDMASAADRARLESLLCTGLIAMAHTKPEFAMQPFSDAHPPAFFVPWTDEFGVTLYADTLDSEVPGLVTHLSKPVGTATVILGSNVFTDWSHINQDAAFSTARNTGNAHEAGHAADWGADSEGSSRFLANRPADEFGHILANRESWKEAVESAAPRTTCVLVLENSKHLMNLT